MIARRTIHFYPGELGDVYAAMIAVPDERAALLAAFEDAFTRHMGAGHAIPVGSGRLGLRLILGALGSIRASSARVDARVRIVVVCVLAR